MKKEQIIEKYKEKYSSDIIHPCQLTIHELQMLDFCIEYFASELSDSEPNETKQIIKGLSGEKIESIPTFTSTDYPVYNENYLKECIKKAEPNLSKIKDVDKELADIRGESNLDFKKKLLDFLIWYQPDNEVAEDIIDKYLSV